MVIPRYLLFQVFAHRGRSWMSGLFFACHVGHNADDAAFAWVAFHLPGVFPPFSKSVKVFSVEVSKAWSSWSSASVAQPGRYKRHTSS